MFAGWNFLTLGGDFTPSPGPFPIAMGKGSFPARAFFRATNLVLLRRHRGRGGGDERVAECSSFSVR